MNKDLTYKEYINSTTWKNKRKEVLEKRGAECEQCGYQYRLHIHHLTYENLGNEKDEDLQILCFLCHMSKHDEHFNKYVLKRAPLQPGNVYLTEELINGLRTSRNAFTGKTMRFLTGTGKPKKGWVRKAIGKQVNIIEYQKIMAHVEQFELKREEKKAKKEKKPKKESNQVRALKRPLVLDLYSHNIKTLNGKSLAYVPLPTLRKLHEAYCKK